MVDAELRLTQLEQVVAAGGEFFSAVIAQRAQTELELVRERIRIGSDFIVVALVGGTGSGKSTLFNRLTMLSFADVSETRPTTDAIMACTWGGDSSRLLDLLSVPRHNRIRHESILTAGNEAHDAFVLLDTPDYDSINIEHSGTVSALIPVVDVAIWVLDPQKYADVSLYSSLIAQGRGPRSLVVVVNRIDTIPPEDRNILLADVRKNLDECGFSGVPVYATSALYGDGVQELDAALAAMTADKSMWQATACLRLDEVAGVLESQLGKSEADLHDGYIEQLGSMVIDAAGVGTVAHMIRSGRDVGEVQPQAPAPTLSVALRDMWVTHAIEGLPPVWKAGVEKAIPSAESVRKRIARALVSVDVPHLRSVRVWHGYLCGGVLIVAGILAGLLGGAFLEFPQRIGICAALVVAGIAWVLLWRIFAQRNNVRRRNNAASSYERHVCNAVTQELAQTLIAGPEAIIKRHRAARTLLNGS